MKRIVTLVLLLLVGIACQTEEAVVDTVTPDALTGTSSLMEKLRRMAQHPTAIDNVIDGTACFSIQLPFTVVVNGQQVTINTVADYQVVRNILAEDDTNDDTIAIQFPVNVTYADYTTATITNMAGFNAAVSGCLESVELSCIHFTFPVGVSTYDSENLLAETFELGNEHALFQFITTAGIYDAITLNYPLNFNAPDGTVLSINSNNELETAINNYTDECIALLDPDPTTNPNPDPDPAVEQVLINGTWYVSYFFRDEDTTADYQNYSFVFNSAGNITVLGGSSPGTGTWSTSLDDGDTELNLSFTSSALEELSEDWTITSYTTQQIEMQKVSGGGDDIRYLYLNRN